jgi:transposase
VSVKEGLSYDSIVGILDRHIRAKVDWNQYVKLGKLGLDEIALKKGHGNFVVIVTFTSMTRVCKQRLSSSQGKVSADGAKGVP